MQYQGDIRKMHTELKKTVQYHLPIGDSKVDMNKLIGKAISLKHSGKIHCIHCGRLTKKSFGQGYCFPCLRSLAECDQCIVRPELCHIAKGTCRDAEWASGHCLQPHIVYLANSSGIKVGITRQSQIPTRWMDQGATQALPLFQVPDRYTSGLVEVALKKHVSDKTDWRRMLKGDAEPVDLLARAEELVAASQKDLDAITKKQGKNAIQRLQEVKSQTIRYPVQQYPEKVSSLNLDKLGEVGGILQGIKGQYLILDSGVINMRKYAGYELSLNA